MHWSADIAAESVAPGAQVTVAVRAAIDPGWYIYSITQGEGGPVRSTITLAADQPFALSGTVEGTQPEVKYDQNFEMQVEVHEGQVAYTGAGRSGGRGGCRKERDPDSGSLPGLHRPDLPSPADREARHPGDDRTAMIDGAFFWLAISAGAFALLTPCVFPMLPITASYFAKHGGDDRGGALRNALLFGAGIVVTFTAAGIATSLLVGAAGMSRFASSPWVNLAIAAMFLAFALNFFGAYEIRVPSSVLARMDALTRDQASSGALGAVLMGTTFAVTTFTCTAPFVGDAAGSRVPGAVAAARRRTPGLLGHLRRAVLRSGADAAGADFASALGRVAALGQDRPWARRGRGRVEVRVECGPGSGVGGLHPPGDPGVVGRCSVRRLRSSCSPRP